MSMSYWTKHDVLIKGRSEDLLKIGKILKRTRNEILREADWYETEYMDEIEKTIKDELDRVKRENKEENVIHIGCSSGDDSHGLFSTYMTNIQEQDVQYSIALYFQMDGEDGKIEGYAFTEDSSTNDIYFGYYDDDGGDLPADLSDCPDVFPAEADWIPDYFRKQ